MFRHFRVIKAEILAGSCKFHNICNKKVVLYCTLLYYLTNTETHNRMPCLKIGNNISKLP